ncbi:alpha/beta hydrolase fold [Parvibaculum lavamentivorans DS-1]|uniref:Alpha/beta hydrolase fold n=1 Tax=Parvibaculum lavamentivorans (strain DS-1 / DSM 13023 / NCIMB 13966) TaxID=402881 RepID=A7HUR6_PARL1|nr:alpha/beta fold hydrolase [Parvibaculum lavamentivorans]ABS63649.1 alpha/beta hydrolase fold [Parvibaculum lavamentivorans DS-1]
MNDDARQGPGTVPEEAAPSRLGDAVDAVYSYAASRYNWEDLIGFLAHLDHDSFRSDAPRDSREIASSLISHLSRADALATRLHGAAEHEADIAYALLLLDADRRVMASNAGGRAVFDAISPAVETGKRLSFREDEHAAIFRRALDDLKKDADMAPVLLRFAGEDGETRLACYLVPGARLTSPVLRAADADEEGPRPLCALIVANKDDMEEAPEIFRKALGLTPAEARLAARLRFGLTLKEAAGELGIAVNTARNQLRSIFDKLGVNRQSDLVRHLTELAALAASMQGAPSARGKAIVTSAERRMVTLPDGRIIALRDLGRPDGMPVVILHPLVQSSLMRPREAVIAGDCGVRLISVERPGIGLSTPDPDCSYVSFAHDLGHVADALGLARFAVLGWASGAPFALAAGSVLGERVTRVALATPRLTFRADLAPVSSMHQFFGGLRRHTWLFEAVFSIMRAKRSRRLFRPMIRNFLENSEPDRLVFEADTSLLDCFTDSFVEALDKTHKGLVGELNFYAKETPVDVSGLARPVLVWHGLRDEMNKAEDVQRMLRNMPVEAFHPMPDDGHMVLFTHFRDVLTSLLNDKH